MSIHTICFICIAGSVLDSSNGRAASLMSTGLVESNNPPSTMQLREGNLTGQKVNYLDSGYSEEDQESQQQQQSLQQQTVTSCLMQTDSGTYYIPGSEYFNICRLS